MSTSCYCLSVKTGAFLSICWSVVYSIVQIAYVVRQEYCEGIPYVYNKQENKSYPQNEGIKVLSNEVNHTTHSSVLHPSVLIPDGWDKDVLSHVHLLLLVLYLAVFISCLFLILGIFRVQLNTFSTTFVTNTYISEYSHLVSAMAGVYWGGNSCRNWDRYMDIAEGEKSAGP